jgi:D-cysteine desulfhydrase
MTSVSQPRIGIGRWPTPIVRAPALSDELGAEIWVKVEEDCGAWGGNKVRKLEYLLADARSRGIRRLTSWGVGTSNWSSAVALHGALQGFEVRLFLWGELPEGYERLYRDLATEVIPIGRLRLSAGIATGLVLSHRGDQLVLPPGGSGPIGDTGSMHAGEEVAAAVNSGEIPRPELVFVALGTCGTSAGLAAGMELGGLHVPVVGVKVAAWPYGNIALARWKTRRLVKRRSSTTNPVMIADTRYFAPGYAQPNDASNEAQELGRLDGFELDGTYAAKAFASLVTHARAKRGDSLLFVHTSPGPPPLDPLGVGSP